MKWKCDTRRREPLCTASCTVEMPTDFGKPKFCPLTSGQCDEWAPVLDASVVVKAANIKDLALCTDRIGSREDKKKSNNHIKADKNRQINRKE